MSIHILHGPDQFRAREALHRIRDGLDSDGNLGNNTTRLEGRGLSPAAGAANVPGLMKMPIVMGISFL